MSFSALLLCFALPTFAQGPEIGGLLPAGGPRGQTTHVRIDGKNLGGARLYLSGSGAAVKAMQVTPNGEQLTAEIAVETGARLGPREVRIATAKGVSNGSRFWVDVYPNKVLEQPMSEDAPPVALDGVPVVVNGRIAAPTRRDRFALTAAAGESWTFDCAADKIRSRLDPVLELRDERGVSLKLVESTWESDPRFCYKFAKAGHYFLTLRDSEYNGEPNYTYRLLVGKFPFVASYMPRGERPGHSVQMTLQGTNLPVTSATVTIPVDAAPGTFWAEVPSGSDTPLVLPLLVSSEAVLNAGDSESVHTLPALPVAVDGIFARSSLARFAFHAAKQTKVLFDLMGRRIGSRIDGAIRVLDSAGKEIAANDDAPGLGKEARLEFAPPADGDYKLEVRNVEEVIGPDCYYRLKATAVEPNFRVFIETDRLTAPIGGTTVLTVNVERMGGFDGPVEISLTNLPAGVISTGGVIPAGKSAVDITLTAALDTALSASDVHIMGKASIGGKPVLREAPAWERYEHRSIDLVLSVEFSYTRPFHLWDMLLMAATERADPIFASLATTPLTLKPGEKIEIPVHITRQPDAKGEIKLDIRGLPAKVTATSAPIPAGQSDGRITLTAAADAAPDLSNIIVQAHHDKATALAPAIRLTLQNK